MTLAVMEIFGLWTMIGETVTKKYVFLITEY